MESSISQIKQLFGNVLAEHRYIDQLRIGLWIKEGDYLKSKVEISIENDEIDYELKFYLSKEEEDLLSPHEIFVFLHEMSHIVILEKIRTQKGMKEVTRYLDKYNDEVKNLNDKAQSNKCSSDEIQKEYENIEFEKQTDEITRELFKRYVSFASH